MTLLTNPKGFKKFPSNNHLLDSCVANGKSGADNSAARDALKVKKAWEIAYSPAKNIPIQGLMLWMSGSGVQIFSISIAMMLIYQPIKAILSTFSTFKPLKSDSSSRTGGGLSAEGKNLNAQMFMPQIVYVLVQLCLLAMGLWKCSSMGLLPSTESDWLSFQRVPEHIEASHIFFTSPSPSLQQ